MLVSNRGYIFVICLPAIAVLVLPSFVHSATARTTMTTYNDPQGRFSVSYPSNWIATPASNRFKSTLLNIEDPAL